jgi:hypothetical protein
MPLTSQRIVLKGWSSIVLYIARLPVHEIFKKGPSMTFFECLFIKILSH